MNITVCTKGGEEKAIRNWRGQCLKRCPHARLAWVRVGASGGVWMHMLGPMLFQCPHVKSRHRKVGKDTHKSEPRTRVDVVKINLAWPSMPRELDNSRDWQAVTPSLDGYSRTEVLEVPRDKWSEWLRVEVEPVVAS